jgi:signal transduction histidine kinase
VLNLLSNAFKFTFEGLIEVRLRIGNCGFGNAEEQTSESEDANQPVSRRCAILTVRDTGTGITEAELPHLFERFHRIRGAKARTHEGSGIGLALIRELARLHGGVVSVESEVGKGTSFTVSIPTGSAHLPADRVSAERASSSPMPAAATYVEEAMRWIPSDLKAEGQIAESGSPGGQQPQTAVLSGRILLADDNSDMRDYVKRILGSHWTVEAVSDGRVALESAFERVPDLVLTDVMMPGLDGFELLRKLRADPRTREVPVILLSARAGEESRVEGLEAGADDYLTKPFSARELVACVGANLKMARVRREAELEREQLLNAERVAREAASAASRAKDEFLATVSHELRSPLNAMLGWARLLSSGTLNHETAARGIRAIEQNAKAQAQLIEDLLDLSRIISGKFHLNNEPTEVVRVIETAIDSLRPTAEAKSVRLQVTLDPDAGPVLGDAQRLQQVVWNLLSNAVKFTPSGGSVHVRLRRRISHAEIEVSDTGQGIDPDFLPYVFERFRQADGSSTRKHGGLGLGLAIVRHITELHGGSVFADSPGKGKGATFTVSLPLMTSHKQDVRDERLDSETNDDLSLNLTGFASLEEVRVLVVDDDPETLLLLSTVLSQCGAQVKTASSADEGFREVQAWRPNLIVSDIGMPGENGYQFMQRVRAWAREEATWIPAVALTAYARTEDRMKALSSGYQIHLPKPVEPAELIAVIVSLRDRAANSGI